MSVIQPNSFYDTEEKKMILEKLTVKIETKRGSRRKPLIHYEEVFDFTPDMKSIILPLGFYTEVLNLELDDIKYKKSKTKFTGKLREHQISVKNEAVKNLKDYNACLISPYCSFGKTVTSLYIASLWSFKTLIITHREALIKQWMKSIQTFYENPKIQIISTTEEIDENNDFFIVNPVIVPRLPENSLKFIGCVIVDEAHLILAKVFYNSLKCLTPKYLIGLTATPYRHDNYDHLFDFYFGTKRIIRELERKHVVYRIDTGVKIKPKLDRDGSPIWGDVLKQQSDSHYREQIAINIVKEFVKVNKGFIFCKRVSQIRRLHFLLKEEGIYVDSVTKDNGIYDENCDVLIGTVQKLGVGFDDTKRCWIVLLSDVVNYFIQILGRVMRCDKKITPIVFDFVDDYSLLEKHYKIREEVYIKALGVFRDLEKDTGINFLE